MICLFGKTKPFVTQTVGRQLIGSNSNILSKVHINNNNPRIIKRHFYDVIVIHLANLDIINLMDIVDNIKVAIDTSDLFNNPNIEKFNRYQAEHPSRTFSGLSVEIDNLKAKWGSSNIPSDQKNLALQEADRLKNTLQSTLKSNQDVLHTQYGKPNFEAGQANRNWDKRKVSDSVTTIGSKLADLVTRTKPKF